MTVSLIDHVVEAARRWQSATGAFGVAVGPKQTDGEVVSPDDRSLTFFVPEKKPRRGSRLRLENGHRLVPKQIKVGSDHLTTDVLSVRPDEPTEQDANMPRKKSRTGGPVSDSGGSMGTFGALVTVGDSDRVYALTNKHVAVGVGNHIYFPQRGASRAVRARVTLDRGLVADEQFVPFVDHPRAYFAVDAALALLAPGALPRFSSDTPYLGEPNGIHMPDMSSMNNYYDSVVNTDVDAYSCNSKLRHGRVSHALFTRESGRGKILVYGLAIQGLDGELPSWEKDSGKLWCTPGPNGEAVGLHLGSTLFKNHPSRFAVATDMALLAGHLNLSLASVS